MINIVRGGQGFHHLIVGVIFEFPQHFSRSWVNTLVGMTISSPFKMSFLRQQERAQRLSSLR